MAGGCKATTNLLFSVRCCRATSRLVGGVMQPARAPSAVAATVAIIEVFMFACSGWLTTERILSARVDTRLNKRANFQDELERDGRPHRRFCGHKTPIAC